MKLFIADDSKVVRESLSTTLTVFPEIEIIGEAQFADEAVKSIQKLKPDVVILDVKMPGGGGINALKTVKKFDIAPVVIMFTAFPYPIYRKICKEAGADFFFSKSDEFKKFIEALRRLIPDFQKSRSPILTDEN